MRYSEFQRLDEITMSPSNLRKLAAQTNAIAGMEFEMVVPNVQGPDNDGDMEPNYDEDFRPRSFDDIYDFFNDGEYNSRRDADRLINQMQEHFSEWAEDVLRELWDKEGFDYFQEYIEDHFDEDSAKEEAEETLKKEYGDELPTEDLEKMIDELVKEKREKFFQEEWEDQGRLYDRAYESWRDDQEDPDESEWLRDQGLTSMSDVESSYSGIVTWPYYTSSNSGETEISEVADEFHSVVGRRVVHSNTYHGAERRQDSYVIEPDSSIDPDDGNDAGLEFVSPPLPIDNMLSDLNKIVNWAKEKGCYTNESTGLHMNVSIPGYESSKLDYVKLALLLGDKYVLDQFNRLSNTYAVSALSKIKSRVETKTDEQIKEYLDKMRGGMAEMASKLIHDNVTDKYTSINAKTGYIEFRSPGGDWLNEDLSKLENTLLRFVVALDAACDKSKYRQEYLKKLYKILQPSSPTDVLTYFANYVAGELPKDMLIRLIRQEQVQRSMRKLGGSSEKYWWRVTSGPNSIEVVATTKEEAIETAIREWGLNPNYASRNMQAVPIKPYTQEPVRPAQTTMPGNQQYEVYMVDNPNQRIGTFWARANDQQSARLAFNSYLSRIGRNSPAGYGYRRIS